MSNKFRAETTCTVGKRTYRLRFDWNSAVEFESVAGGKQLAIAMMELAHGNVSATALRAMLWAGMRQRHPKVTLTKAGLILGRIGRSEAMRVMGVALRYFYPELLGDPGDPQSPAPATSSGGGTGQPSAESQSSASGG